MSEAFELFLVSDITEWHLTAGGCYSRISHIIHPAISGSERRRYGYRSHRDTSHPSRARRPCSPCRPQGSGRQGTGAARHDAGQVMQNTGVYMETGMLKGVTLKLIKRVITDRDGEIVFNERT